MKHGWDKMKKVFRVIRLYVLFVGVACLGVGLYAKCYTDLLDLSVKAIEENRLDMIGLEEAKKNLFADKALVTYNMGVRACRAGNLKNASTCFYDVIRDGSEAPDILKQKAYYNLGNVFVRWNLPKKAGEMYRNALRLDPDDWEAKYNLERLYVFYPMAFPDEKEQASLEQEPGANKDDQGQMGLHGDEQPDI